MLFLDGAYTFRGTKASFHRARRLQPDELAKLLASLSRRIVRLLERRGLLIADPQHPVLEFDVGSALDQIQAASVKYCIAVGPHAGRKALTLYSVPPVDDSTGCGLLAQVAGFSLHAATVCEAHQRSKLERLCRYITRPPIATKRLSLDRRGRVVYQYKRPFRDGSTHVVLEPLDFIARRAALVPRPRLNLTRKYDSFPIGSTPGNTGNELGSSPENQFSVTLDSRTPVAGGRFMLFANVSYSWVDDYFTGATNDPDLVVPSHDVLGARAGLESGSGRWRFELWGSNLLDEDVVLIPSDFIVKAKHLGAPRLYGARITLSY